MMNYRLKTHACLTWLAMLSTLIVGGITDSEARGLPMREGILNFAKVSDRLYRGAQPNSEGIKSLKNLGVKTIINLRMTEESWKDEAALAVAHGISYTNVPFRGFGRPSDEQVQKVLEIIETSPGPVFVHCLHGCDRTGTVVACYRIKHDRWPTETALKEAAVHGLSWLERGMKKFVLYFGQRGHALAKGPEQNT
jgi:protein tyrosine phosphatase (PTP) superfamily phosphohydrolase (DUF442 family)